MTGETHINTAVTCGMLLFSPQSITELALGTGLLVIGATISDIDASNSRAKQQVVRIRAYIVVTLIIIYIISKQTGLNIFLITVHRLKNSPTVIAIATLFLMCLYGSKTTHRTFMHSILACMLLALCIGLITDIIYVKYFLVGFISHILLDLLNERPVSVLYPLNKKFSLRLCRSSGLIDKILFAITGITGCILLFIRFTNL